MDSPWEENPGQDGSRDMEWSRISSEFTNIGYREGITAGKESALQEGFDDGFASVGAPLGCELGLLRGISSAILSFLASFSSTSDHNTEQEWALTEACDIATALANIRFTDIAPRDVDAEEHARQHLESDDTEMEVNEKLSEKRDMEVIEDMLTKMTASASAVSPQRSRPNGDDIRKLEGRLKALSQQLGLESHWS